jgi:hypothetical protein
MRAWVAVAVITVAMAVGVTDGVAQSRMTFRCHDPAASVCDGRFVMNGTETFVLGVYDSGFLSPPADGWESALFTGTGDVRYYRGLVDIPINVST